MDIEVLIVVLTAAVGIPAVIALMVRSWSRVSAWMVKNAILASASAHPIIALPGGAGLDASRLAVLVSLVVLLGAAAYLAAVSKIRRTMDRHG